MENEVPYVCDVDEMAWWFAERGTDPTTDEIELAGGRVGREQYPALVLELRVLDLLAPNVASRVVSDAWVSTERPLADLDRDEWRDLFGLAGFTVDGVRAPRRRPRKARRLYRGTTAKYQDGWSWTEDRTLARWFAEEYQHRTRGAVYVVDAPPSSVLAIITGANGFGRSGAASGSSGGPAETEWIVDTDGLDITEAARSGPRTNERPRTR